MSSFNPNNTIDSIINYFGNRGIQKANRFSASISCPVGTGVFPVMISQVPGQVVTYYPDSVGPAAPYVEFPIKREYDSRFYMEFPLDETWECRKFFENWIDYVFNTSNARPVNINVRHFDDVVGTININGLNENGNVTGAFTLYKAWPATIMPTYFMQGARDQILTMGIDINYRYYRFDVSGAE